MYDPHTANRTARLFQEKIKVRGTACSAVSEDRSMPSAIDRPLANTFKESAEEGMKANAADPLKGA
jgi:hypothetical protein